MSAAFEQELIGLLVIAGVIALCWKGRVWTPTGSSHGTARWADKSDLKQAGMLDQGGLLLGRTFDGALLWMKAFVHLVCFSPAGGGKSTGFCIPWLLSWFGGSTFSFDPKGELYKATADTRRRKGRRVHRIDPFGVCGPGGATLNLIDLILEGEEGLDLIRAFAGAIVTTSGKEHDPHWNEQAVNVLTAIIAFVATFLPPEERNLASVRDIITDSLLFEKAVAMMRARGGLFARLAGMLETLKDKEKAGVLSTVNRHTTFLDSPAISATTNESNFDITELREGNMDIYLILPPPQIAAQSRFLRLVIAGIIRLIGERGMDEGKTLLMLLDEAGQIGHMEPIEQGLTLLRGYGLRMAFFYQSMGQLKECFEDREAVLLDNTEAVFTGVNSLETAKHVSERLGEYTQTLITGNEGTSSSYQKGGNDGSVNVSNTSGTNYAEGARHLLKPEEVLALPGDTLIAFLRSVPPILARRIKYFSDPFFSSGGASGPPQEVLALLAVMAIAAAAWLAGLL